MGAGFALGTCVFNVDSSGFSLSTVAHRQGSGSVTRTSHDAPDVKLLCFGAIAMEFSGRQLSPGPNLSQIMLRAAKQGYLSEQFFLCITSLVEWTRASHKLCKDSTVSQPGHRLGEKQVSTSYTTEAYNRGSNRSEQEE